MQQRPSFHASVRRQRAKERTVCIWSLRGWSVLHLGPRLNWPSCQKCTGTADSITRHAQHHQNAERRSRARNESCGRSNCRVRGQGRKVHTGRAEERATNAFTDRSSPGAAGISTMEIRWRREKARGATGNKPYCISGESRYLARNPLDDVERGRAASSLAFPGKSDLCERREELSTHASDLSRQFREVDP